MALIQDIAQKLQGRGNAPGKVGDVIGAYASGEKDKYDLYQAAAQMTPNLQKRIGLSIKGMRPYEIPEEASQRLALLEEASEGLRTQSQELTDVARMEAGAIEAPGSGQALKDIQSATSAQVGALQQVGGPGFLSSLSQVGAGEQRAMKDFAMSNLAYKSQSETGLMSALRNQASAEQQAGMLEAQGLEGMISERDKEYQSELTKAQTGLQYDITKLGMEEQRKAAEANRPRLFGLI